MKDSELRTRTKALALHIIAVCDEVDTRKGRGVLVGSNAISEQTAKDLLQECGVIRRMLVKSITTAKENA